MPFLRKNPYFSRKTAPRYHAILPFPISAREKTPLRGKFLHAKQIKKALKRGLYLQNFIHFSCAFSTLNELPNSRILIQHITHILKNFIHPKAECIERNLLCHSRKTLYKHVINLS